MTLPFEVLVRRAIVVILILIFVVWPVWASPYGVDLWGCMFAIGGSWEWWSNMHSSKRPYKPAWAWFLFVMWFAPFVISLLKYRDWVSHRAIVECIFIFNVIGDNAQLLVGVFLGRHMPFPEISPNKTIEGYLGGLVAVTVYGHEMHAWSWGQLVLIYVAACCGDLFFSSVKRRLDIKDYSSIFGSHGGVLDRLDSTIFAVNTLCWSSAAGLQL